MSSLTFAVMKLVIRVKLMLLSRSILLLHVVKLNRRKLSVMTCVMLFMFGILSVLVKKSSHGVLMCKLSCLMLSRVNSRKVTSSVLVIPRVFVTSRACSLLSRWVRLLTSVNSAPLKLVNSVLGNRLTCRRNVPSFLKNARKKVTNLRCGSGPFRLRNRSARSNRIRARVMK